MGKVRNQKKKLLPKEDPAPEVKIKKEEMMRSHQRVTRMVKRSHQKEEKKEVTLPKEVKVKNQKNQLLLKEDLVKEVNLDQKEDQAPEVKEKKPKKDKKEENQPKVEKKEENQPKVENKEENQPKAEKKEENQPKVEKKEETHPKVEKAVKEVNQLKVVREENLPLL